MGGELVVTAPDATTQQLLAIPLAKLSSQVSVLARWRVDGLAAGAATFEVGVAARDRRPAGIAQLQCGAVRDSIGDHLRVDTNTSTMSQLMPNLFDTAGLYRVAGSLTGANVGCALIADNSQGAVQAAITPDAMSEADLVARAVTARFSYVLIVAYDPSAAP